MLVQIFFAHVLHATQHDFFGQFYRLCDLRMQKSALAHTSEKQT